MEKDTEDEELMSEILEHTFGLSTENQTHLLRCINLYWYGDRYSKEEWILCLLNQLT